MNMANIADAMTGMIALLIALTFHEAAHAYVARWQGDHTAEAEGRLTLNPIPHIDPIGTLILPAVMFLFHSPILFGWAKPVPVNPSNMRNQKWGYVMVASAGPFANLLMCFLCVLVISIYALNFSETIPKDHFLFPTITLLQQMMIINAILAVFNMLPFPPLDGGTIFPAFLPQSMREIYDDYLAPYGSFILIAMIITGSLSWLQTMAYAWISVFQHFIGLFL